MPGEENSPEPPSFEGAHRPVDAKQKSVLPYFPYRQARPAMMVVCALLALAALASLACGVYQGYRFLATGGAYLPTTVPWSNVLGHFLRAVVLGLLCWRLAKIVGSVNAQTGAPSAEFPACHRIFWRLGAWVVSIVAAYAVFEAVHNWWERDTYAFFRPEFESGFVEIKPNRLEFRRGSAEPVAGWLKARMPDSEKEVFVSPVPEITGNDVRRATVRIAEIFPGSQSVELRIRFTEEGARKMEKLTKSHLTMPLAVLVDGKLRAAPRVFSPIEADAQLSNVFTLQEAARMIQNGTD